MAADKLVKNAFTVQEAAESYGVSPDVIRSHIKAGNIAVKYPSSRPVIPADELEAWFSQLPSEPRR